MKHDIELLKDIFQMSQDTLFSFLKKEMLRYYPSVDSNGKEEMYIYCKGTDPVMLVSHLDVFHDVKWSHESGASSSTYDYSYAVSKDRTADLIGYDEYWRGVDYSDYFDYEEPESTHRDIDIFYDREQQVMWSPDGIGGDDRDRKSVV